MKKKRIDAEDEGIRAYYLGFLERVDAPWGLDEDGRALSAEDDKVQRRRTYFVFDCIKADGFGRRKPEDRDNLAYIYLSTTVGKFSEMASGLRDDGLKAPPEGNWYLLELVKRKGGPRAWLASVNNNGAPEEPEIGWRLDKITFLTDTRDRPREEIRADGPPPILTSDREKFRQEIAPHLLLKFYVSATEDENPPAPTNRTLDCEDVIAVDVGHGNCIALRHNGKVKAYFDVGYPMGWNMKSKPKYINYLSADKDCIIVLSHWDFDHYGLATVEARLRKMPWIAPEAYLGPNATKFAKSLPNLRKMKHGTPLTLGRLEIGWGSGSDKNNRGMVGLVTISKKRILLAADTSYEHIPPDFKKRLAGLTIPHHGAKCRDAVPTTGKEPAIAMICGGTPNQ